MNGLPYYKAYPRDFIEGTIGMAFELKAAYRLLLDLIYMQGGRLPDDPRYISGQLGCSTRAWNGYRKALIDMGKIITQSGIISNFRADKELESLAKLQDNQRKNGSQPKKNNSLTQATAEPARVKPEPEPEPYISNIVADAPKRLNGAFDLFWAEFPKKVGKTAARRNFDRVVKAGADPNEVIAGAARYAAQVAGKEHGFVKHPQGWLTDGRWSDEAPAHIPQQSAEAGDRTSFLRKIAGARP